jgi:hypothetical protein
MAWYKPGDGIFDEALKPETNCFIDRSFHEMVLLSGSQASTATWMHATAGFIGVDAYTVQNRYLGVIDILAE